MPTGPGKTVEAVTLPALGDVAGEATVFGLPPGVIAARIPVAKTNCAIALARNDIFVGTYSNPGAQP